METYSVRVAGDDHVFSAAHFIVLGDGSCEPLHGHDYRVSAEVEGPLNENHYVVDFCLLDNFLSAVLDRLDHRTLLPSGGDKLQVVAATEEVEVRFAARRWRFPADDCALLPVANTTSEAIARHLAEMLLERLREALPADALPRAVKIDICESPGRTASCRIIAR